MLHCITFTFLLSANHNGSGNVGNCKTEVHMQKFINIYGFLQLELMESQSLNCQQYCTIFTHAWVFLLK